MLRPATPKLMSSAEIETLVLTVSFDRDVTPRELGAILGDEGMSAEEAHREGMRRLKPLIRAGAVWRSVSGLFHPTEKGRIAAGLLIAKNPALFHAFFDE